MVKQVLWEEVESTWAPYPKAHQFFDTLNVAVNKWQRLPETVQYFEQRQNAPKPVIMTAEEFTQKQDRDVEVWRKMIEESKVTL